MQLVQTELLRGLLAPVGHGLWTAILGGVLFSASGRQHFALTGRLLATYLGVSVLHALWDSMHSIALVLTLLLTGGTYESQVEPTGAQAGLFTVLSWGGLIVVSLVGVMWLLRVRSAADREARAVLWRIPVRSAR
jgi:hypothetical protein